MRRGGEHAAGYASLTRPTRYIFGLRLTALKSPRAIAVNVEIMRAFVRLREMLSSNKELKRKLDELERRLGAHDQAIGSILSAIRELMAPPEPAKKRRMGFIQDED